LSSGLGNTEVLGKKFGLADCYSQLSGRERERGEWGIYMLFIALHYLAQVARAEPEFLNF
jgi:hypothetical protein